MSTNPNELNAEIKRLNGALRELAIASSESLAEARFDLKASQEALAEAPVLWTCPDCAFSYDTRHALPDGTFNCPVCGEARLEADLKACQDVLMESVHLQRLQMEKAEALAEAVRAMLGHMPRECAGIPLANLCTALAEWEGQ